MRIIKTAEDIVEGAAYLCGLEPVFARIYPACAPLSLRLKPEGFDQLLYAITGQQVSVASAASVCNKLEKADLHIRENVAKASEDDLRACGLSRQKIRYAYALARSDVDFAALRNMPSDQVIKTLTALPGIGPWTAEIYAMFSLGHADVFAPGDLAMQESARILFDLADRPKEAAFREMAQAWAPWRSVAARLLWDYYQLDKNREGIR